MPQINLSLIQKEAMTSVANMLSLAESELVRIQNSLASAKANAASQRSKRDGIVAEILSANGVSGVSPDVVVEVKDQNTGEIIALSW